MTFDTEYESEKEHKKKNAKEFKLKAKMYSEMVTLMNANQRIATNGKLNYMNKSIEIKKTKKISVEGKSIQN